MKFTLALVFVLAAAVGVVCGTTDAELSDTKVALDVGTSDARNSLLHRASISRGAISNTVLVHDHTWRGAASRRISRITTWTNQGASARIIGGGVGSSFVTVRITSQRGRGFNSQIDVYGR